MQGSEHIDLQPLQLGHQRKIRVIHLVCIPILFLIIYWYDWASSAVIPCCFFLFVVVYISFSAQNRHISIDPIRKEVEIGWIQWGIFSIDKRRYHFDEFSAVRYHTYLHGTHDNRPEAQFGLYLVHSVADLWPCGDTGLDRSEPKYDRDLAIAVAQMMGLPLLESDDEPWADRPRFKKTTLFSEPSCANQGNHPNSVDSVNHDCKDDRINK